MNQLFKNVTNKVNSKLEFKYKKPDTIKNGDLLVEGGEKGIVLKDNLNMNYDFVAVSGETWKHLYAWYSADFSICRFMKRDKFNKRLMELDLYPKQNQLGEM